MTSQRGAVVPVVAAGLVFTVFLTLALAVITSAVVTRRAAAAGADLAALAGAVAVQRGQQGCAAAAAVARSNEVEVVACVIEAETVTVTVARDAPTPWGRRLTVLVRARAGPSSSPSAEEGVQQRHRTGLVERVVAVAALG